ncbi:MFS transporter [Pseudotabrizicola formosa]|uniref:MFS transporter n=1 Tax=Pseudotabrizicola formosa TaxID=2030009 RepID=UPI0011AF2BE7|nr:MFS transporter [Pseudotabrizicola formosa]
MKDVNRANTGLLLVGIATFVMMGAGQSLYGPALPAFGRSLSLSAAQAGWLVSAHWIGCAIGVAAMYRWGAAVSPRISIGIMLGGAALIAAALGTAVTFVGALTFGTGYGLATVVFNPRILRAYGARGTAMVSLVNASFGAGAIVAPLVFVWLGSNPALSYALVAGLAALIWLGAGPAGRAAPPPAAGSTGPFRPMLAFQMFAVAGIGIEAALIGLGPSALIRSGLSEAAAARLLSAFFVAFLGARTVLIFTAHLTAPFLLYVGAMIAATVSATLAIFVSPGVFFVAMGLSAGLFFPGFYVAASRRMGDDPRTAPTIIAAGLVGGIAAPVVLAPVLERLGSGGFFTALAIVSATCAVLSLYLCRRLPELQH